MIRLSSIFLIVFMLGVPALGVIVAIYSGYGVESHAEDFSHFPNFVTIAEERCPTEMCELVLYVVFGIFCLIISLVCWGLYGS